MKTKLLIFLLVAVSISMSNKGGFKSPKMTNKMLDKNYKKWLKNDMRYYQGTEPNTFITVVDDEDKKTDYFTLYNSTNLKAIKSFKIPLKKRESGQKMFKTDYVILKEGIIQVYSYYDSKLDKFYVKGQRFDLKGKSQGKTVSMGTFSVKRKSEVGIIKYTTSGDKSKIAIYRNPPDGRFEDEVLAISLFDNELNKIYDRDLKVSSASLLADVDAVLVNDSGKLFLAIQEYEVKNPAKKKQKRELSNSEFKLYTIDQDNEVLDEIKIKSKNKFIFTVNAVLSDDGNKLILSGLHNDVKNETKKEKRKSSYGFNGVYYISLDTKNWGIETEKFSDIDNSDLQHITLASISTDINSRKANKKLNNNDIELSSYKTRNVFVKKDNTLVMIMEKVYVVRVCTRDAKTGIESCTYYYYNLEILEFHLNTEGVIERVVVIPKRQISPNTDFFNGFITILNEDDEIVHIYNDHSNNFNIKKQAKHNNPFKYSFSAAYNIINRPKWMLAAVSAESPDKSGKSVKGKSNKINKNPYYDNFKKTSLLMPKHGISINKNVYICSYYIRKPKAFGISSFSYANEK